MASFSPSSSMMAENNNMDAELNEIADAFKRNVYLQDRTYRLRTYKQCFIASEAVDYLVTSGQATSRQDAVELGRALQMTHLFEHVTRDHEFSDDFLFFRFLGDTERGGFKMDETTGKAIDWSDFLAPVSGRGGSFSSPSVRGFQSLLPELPLPDLEALQGNDTYVASRLWPLDTHNRTLLNNVHPPQWQDPEGKSTYDLLVIGGGAAGLSAASVGAGVGAKVALIEEHMLGGDSLNVGCIPSKVLIHSANLAHTIRGNLPHLQEAGIFLNPLAVTVDFELVMDRVRRIRSEISRKDSAERYTKELGVEVFIGRAKFTSEKTVAVNGRTLTFRRAVIATGAYPGLLPIPGLKKLWEHAIAVEGDLSTRPIVMTNETVFNLTKQPQNMVVIGAGPAGTELSQAFQRLGTSVTVLEMAGRILPKEDEDMAEIVMEQMVKDGITLHLDVKVITSVQETGNYLEYGYPEIKITFEESGLPKEILCDALLICVGRCPNVTGMDLELAKVEYDTRKGILVNDKLQTTNAHVYGAGDCCDLMFQFTHAADFLARAAVRNALFFGKEKVSNLIIPFATFTSPEIASVGLYGKDLDEKGISYRVIDKHFKDNDRSIVEDATDGFVRFRVDAKNDTILGASIVGEGAGNMISEVALAMKSKTGLRSLGAVIHPYPTTAETLRQSGDAYSKARLTTTVKSLLRGIVKLHGK